MTLNEAGLAEVEAARARLEAIETEVYEARAAFHQAIRRLYALGASMREIATALAMSHQRVHQILGEEGIVEVEARPVGVESMPVARPESAGVDVAPDACSFCGTLATDSDRLLAAPGRLFICPACVTAARRSLVAVVDAECSFCRRPSTSLATPGASAPGPLAICDACVAACERIIGTPVSEPARKVVARRNARMRCSFCNASQADVTTLVAGIGVYICDQCVPVVRTVLESGAAERGPRQVMLRPAMAEDHACGFCRKPPALVAGMVKGGRTRICDECLALADSIVARSAAEAAASS